MKGEWGKSFGLDTWGTQTAVVPICRTQWDQSTAPLLPKLRDDAIPAGQSELCGTDGAGDGGREREGQRTCWHLFIEGSAGSGRRGN